jgi:hypothetical protein
MQRPLRPLTLPTLSIASEADAVPHAATAAAAMDAHLLNRMFRPFGREADGQCTMQASCSRRGWSDTDIGLSVRLSMDMLTSSFCDTSAPPGVTAAAVQCCIHGDSVVKNTYLRYAEDATQPPPPPAAARPSDECIQSDDHNDRSRVPHAPRRCYTNAATMTEQDCSVPVSYWRRTRYLEIQSTM